MNRRIREYGLGLGAVAGILVVAALPLRWLTVGVAIASGLAAYWAARVSVNQLALPNGFPRPLPVGLAGFGIGAHVVTMRLFRSIDMDTYALGFSQLLLVSAALIGVGRLLWHLVTSPAVRDDRL